MTSEEYEAYVEEVIGNLSPFRRLHIRRNERIPGVRQPGQYEIDVAVEFFIGDKLRFLLIVECKNWKRPVGREVVQKLSQTRDAIAAHKAVICSPVGFTREATEVARAHGIALWVIADERRESDDLSLRWDTVQLSVNFEAVRRHKIQRRVRETLMQLWQWSMDDNDPTRDWRLRNYNSVAQAASDEKITGRRGVFRTRFKYLSYNNAPLADEGWVGRELFDAVLEAATAAEATRTEIELVNAQCDREIVAEEEHERRRWDAQRAFKSALAEAALTLTQYRVLDQLGKATAMLSREELNVSVDAATTSVGASLIGLVKKGYVSTVMHSESRDTTDWYQITASGSTALSVVDRGTTDPPPASRRR